MKIGIDLDNTIFDYSLFWNEEATKNHLVSDNPKQALKSKLSPIEWLEVQSLIYGERVRDIHVSSGWSDLFQWAQRNNLELEIVSHKTEFCYCNKRKLRDSAVYALQRNNLNNIKTTFLNSKAEKIEYINAQSFDVFIDDLEEIVSNLNIPLAILFGQRNSNFHSVNRPQEVLDTIEFIGHHKRLIKISRSTFHNGIFFFKYITDRDRLRREMDCLGNLGRNFLEKNCVLRMDFIKNLSVIATINKEISLKILQGIGEVARARFDYIARDSIVHKDSWIRLGDRLEKNTSNYKRQLLEIYQDYNFEYLIEVKKIFMTPDFSPNNMKFNEYGEVLIFDFESAGLDDPFRVLVNFLLHPQNNLSHQSNIEFLKAFKNKYKEYFVLRNLPAIFTYSSLLWLDIISRKGHDIDKELEACRQQDRVKTWRLDYYEELQS